MPTPTNQEIEFALTMQDDATATFRKFASETRGGAAEVERELVNMGHAAEGAEGHAWNLRDAMKENRFENRRNKFIMGEMNDGMMTIGNTMKALGGHSQGMTSAFNALNGTTRIGIETFMGFDAIMKPLGFAEGPMFMAVAGVVALGVAIAEMSGEAEKSEEKIRLTADAVKALDDAYTKYASKFKHGGRSKEEIEAQKRVAEEDVRELQRQVNRMYLFSRSFTGESVKIQNAAGEVAQWSGKNLRKALENITPEAAKLWKEYLAAADGDEEKAIEKFREHQTELRDELAAASDVARRGVVKDEDAKQEKIKQTYDFAKVQEVTYLNESQRRRVEEMIQTSEIVRTFMQQDLWVRRAIVEENNSAWVKNQLATVKGVTNQAFAAIDAKMLEIDDGWKTFLSSVNAGVESLASSIQEGFVQGWEGAFGEANSVLEKFLQAMYAQTMAVLAKIAAQQIIGGILGLIPGVGSVVSAAFGMASGAGSNNKFDGRRIDVSSARPVPVAPVVVVNLRGTLAGQQFLQDEMPTYGRYLAAKTV